MTFENNGNTTAMHDLSRLAYLQGLVAHRRVLLVSRERALAEFVSKARARTVTSVFDDDPVPRWPDEDPAAGKFVRSAPGALPVGDGSFDVAIALDLTSLADPAALLGELRRAVGARGVVVVGVPNPTCERRLGPAPGRSGLDYYQLFDLLSGSFRSVQMIGQAPFAGYTISDLSAAEDRGVSFDASLLDGSAEEIEWFLAVCGDRPVALEAYSVVQLPLSALPLGAATAAQGLEEELRNARLEIGTRGVRIEKLEKDLEHERGEAEAARERAVKIAKQFDDERKAAQARRLEDEMSKRGSEIDLQTKARELAVRLKQAEARAESAEAARDDLVERIRGDVGELDGLRDRVRELEEKRKAERAAEKERAAELDRLRREAEAARQEAAAARAEAASAAAKKGAEERERTGDRDREAFERDIAAIEERLVVSSRELAAANEELARREALIRDLVVEVERAAAGVAARPADVQERDQRIALLEAELQAATWRVEELEARSEDEARTGAGKGPAGTADEGALAAAREQIAVLEEALAAARGAASGQHRARVESQLALATAEREKAGLQAELDEQIGELRCLEEALAAAVGTVSGHRRARVEAELALATAEREKAGLQAELDEQIAGARELEGRLAAALGAVSGHHRARVEAELEAATAALERDRDRTGFFDSSTAAEQDLIRARARIRALEGDLARLTGEAGLRSDADARVAALDADLTAERRRSVELEQGFAAARRNAERLEGDLDRERERAANAAADLGKAAERCAALEADLAASAEARCRMETDLSALRVRADELGARREELEARLAEAGELLRRAEEARAAAGAELDGARAAADDRTGELRSSLEHMRTELGRANWRVDELLGERDRIREQLEKERHIASETRVELESAERETDLLRRRAAELEAAAGELEAARDRERARFEALAKEMAQERRTTAEETERTRQAGADAARLAGELARLEESLSKAAKRAEEREVEVETMGRALAALRTEVSEANARLADKRKAKPVEPARDGKAAEEIARLRESTERLAAEHEALVARIQGECAARVAQIDAELESTRSSLEVRQNQLQEYAANLSEMRRELEETEERCDALAAERDGAAGGLSRNAEELSAMGRELSAAREELASAREQLARGADELARLGGELAGSREEFARARDEALVARGELSRAEDALKKATAAAAESPELAQLRVTVARQTERIRELTDEAAARDPLLASLTAQLEEREKRAAAGERKVKQLEEQIKEHLSDAAAWNTEITFRNARIAQLEEEVGKARSLAPEGPQRAEPQARRSRLSIGPDLSQDLERLRAQVEELNDTMGEKDAELLVLHTKADSTKRSLIRARQALQGLLNSGSMQSSMAIQLHDIITAMERDGK